MWTSSLVIIGYAIPSFLFAILLIILFCGGNYLNWFARVGFPEGELGRMLALMQEIDHNGLKALLEPIVGQGGK